MITTGNKKVLLVRTEREEQVDNIFIRNYYLVLIILLLLYTVCNSLCFCG
jgi:hypothetical protein